MSSIVISDDIAVSHVNIGKSMIGSDPLVMEANLGSCIGIGLAWREKRTFAMAHCLLPSREANPTDMRLSRFASTAPQYLLKRLKVPRNKWKDVRGVIAGGANMYRGGGRSHEVGEKNIAEANKALREAGIKVIGRNVGGAVARRLRVDCNTGLAYAILLNDDKTVTTVKWRLIL